MGSIDLGDRVVEVLLIPGHEATHIAFYDRDTQLLLTGDTLYPGRLYVRDWAAYCASIGRLVRFIDDGHPITHVIGAHIELSADNVEYPEGATEHPNEHPLPLGEAHLRDLLSTVTGMANAPTRTKRESYVVVPLA
jgi:glyoxylase-like metal-dependent hydrolase (beta-lactamase superfamily II)